MQGRPGAHRCVWQQELISLLFRQSIQHARVTLQNAHAQRIVIIHHILCRCTSNTQPCPPMRASAGAALLWARHILLSSQQCEWAHSAGTVLCTSLRTTGRSGSQPKGQCHPWQSRYLQHCNLKGLWPAYLSLEQQRRDSLCIHHMSFSKAQSGQDVPGQARLRRGLHPAWERLPTV